MQMLGTPETELLTKQGLKKGPRCGLKKTEDSSRTTWSNTPVFIVAKQIQ
jgi:hypothetical protein